MFTNAGKPPPTTHHPFLSFSMLGFKKVTKLHFLPGETELDREASGAPCQKEQAHVHYNFKRYGLLRCQ